MASPVWLDGPLKGQEYDISADLVDEGMFRYDTHAIYTFTLVSMLEHVVVVGSVANGIPSPELLFSALLTPEAQRAAR